MKAFIAVLLLAIAVCAQATTYNVNTSTPKATITNIVAGLKGGDILNLASGVYTNLNLNLANLKGSSSAWITINGNNATIKCGGSVSPIVLGASAFIKITGLTITTTGAKNIAGIQFNAACADIVISGCTFVNINGNGITINANNIVKVLIDSNTFTNCGKVHSTGGIAISVGSVHTALKNVAQIVINNNVVSQISANIAISVGLGVIAPQITNNVIFDCNGGISVVTGIVNQVVDLLPRVFANQVFSIANIAINIGAGTQCVNNYIVNVGVGINLVLGGSVSVLANTTIAQNSIYGINVAGLQILAGLPDSTLVIVNNAIAVGEGLLGAVLNVVDGLLNSVATILNNVVSGLLSVNANLNLNLGLHLGREVAERQTQGPLPLGFLAVALQDLFGGLSDVVDELRLLPLKALVNEVLTTVQDVVDQVGALLVNVLPDVQQIVDDLIPNLKALVEALGLGGLLDPVLDAVQGTVDDLVPDLIPVVNDLVDTVDTLVPTLIADLDPLLSKTLKQVLTVLGNVLDTLGSTLFNVVTDLGKRDSPLQLSSLISSVSDALNLVLGAVPGTVGELIQGVSNTLNNILSGILDGSIVDQVLSGDELGLGGLLQAVVNLVEQILTAVSELLVKLTQGLDTFGLKRIGQFTIGAVQAGAEDLVPTLGELKNKLLPAARSVAVANIRSQ